MSVEGFLRMSNDFNWFTDLRPVAFRIAVYLASKPDDWTVRESDVRKRCKGIGHDAYLKAIGELVEAGMLERSARAGHGTRPPMILSELYKRIRAGHNESRKPDFHNTGEDTGILAGQNESRVSDPGYSRRSERKSEIRPLNKTDSYTKTESNKTEAVAPAEAVGFADKSLSDLVREAPNARTLEALWRVHKDSGWNDELNKLASARKAELASAIVNEPAPEAPENHEPATQVESVSTATDLYYDAGVEYSTGSEYGFGDEWPSGTIGAEVNQAESPRFFTSGRKSYRPSFS